jgi:hypothetical protein
MCFAMAAARWQFAPHMHCHGSSLMAVYSAFALPWQRLDGSLLCMCFAMAAARWLFTLHVRCHGSSSTAVYSACALPWQQFDGCLLCMCVAMAAARWQFAPHVRCHGSSSMAVRSACALPHAQRSPCIRVRHGKISRLPTELIAQGGTARSRYGIMAGVYVVWRRILCH